MVKLNECFLVALNIGRTMSSTNRGSLAWLADLQTSLKLPIRCYDQELLDAATIDVIVNELKLVTKSEGRTQLMIAGSHIESDVTFLSLRALAEGFDVYLLTDLISSQDHTFNTVYQTRLFQAGAVLTTMSQLMQEWRSAEVDALIADRLFFLLKMYTSNSKVPAG